MRKPESADEAFQLGVAVGAMWRHGIHVTPVVDDDGDFTNAWDWVYTGLDGQTRTARLTVELEP